MLEGNSTLLLLLSFSLAILSPGMLALRTHSWPAATYPLRFFLCPMGVPQGHPPPKPSPFHPRRLVSGSSGVVPYCAARGRMAGQAALRAAWPTVVAATAFQTGFSTTLLRLDTTTAPATAPAPTVYHHYEYCSQITTVITATTAAAVAASTTAAATIAGDHS